MMIRSLYLSDNDQSCPVTVVWSLEFQCEIVHWIRENVSPVLRNKVAKYYYLESLT